MSKQHVLGSHVTGLRSRSHHPHWADCSPIGCLTKIDRIKSSVETWNHIHRQDLLRERVRNSRVLYAI